MTRHTVSLREGATIDEALALLLREEAVEIYVGDTAECLTGVVPDYELLKARLTRMPGCEPVEHLASRSVATIDPDTLVTEIAPVFRDGRYRQMAVVERGRLVGQIGRREILRLMAEAHGKVTTLYATDDPMTEESNPVYRQRFTVEYDYPVCFTDDLFSPDNPVLRDAVCRTEPDRRHRREEHQCADRGQAPDGRSPVPAPA
jgi:predicted transcriptional regulator